MKNEISRKVLVLGSVLIMSASIFSVPARAKDCNVRVGVEMACRLRAGASVDDFFATGEILPQGAFHIARQIRSKVKQTQGLKLARTHHADIKIEIHCLNELAFDKTEISIEGPENYRASNLYPLGYGVLEDGTNTANLAMDQTMTALANIQCK